MRIIKYNKEKALQYAKKWAMDRNPEYYNFDTVGGDCTSFISQIMYSGSGIMNYKKYNCLLQCICMQYCVLEHIHELIL